MARSDKDLRSNKVDARHTFRHRVLHLDARIHLDEEPVVLIHVIEKLDGARIVVADALGEFYGGFTKFLADLRIEVHGWRHFDDFLIAPLHRAIALVKVDDIALLVSENLHFNVLGAGNVAFQKNSGVTKSIECFVLRLS